MDDHGPDPAVRVETALDEARIDAGFEWVDVAERAGISVPTLFRFRKGQRTPEATRKVENAFGWPRGYLDAVAAGEPLPEQQQPPRSTDEQIHEAAMLLKRATELLEQIERHKAG